LLKHRCLETDAESFKAEKYSAGIDTLQFAGGSVSQMRYAAESRHRQQHSQPEACGIQKARTVGMCHKVSPRRFIVGVVHRDVRRAAAVARNTSAFSFRYVSRRSA
jgi:hypothetical protein